MINEAVQAFKHDSLIQTPAGHCGKKDQFDFACE